MENWMVMGAAFLLVCLVYPPMFGIVIGLGASALLLYIFSKLLGA